MEDSINSIIDTEKCCSNNPVTEETNTETQADDSKISRQDTVTFETNLCNDIFNYVRDKLKILDKSFTNAKKGKENIEEENKELKEKINDFEVECENGRKFLVQQAQEKAKISTEYDKLWQEYEIIKKQAKSYEKTIKQINGAIFGAIKDPLSKLELNLSILANRKEWNRDDIFALMDLTSDLRKAFEDIRLGEEYQISIRSCIDEETWEKQQEIDYDEQYQFRGKEGKKAIVRSRGFIYKNNLGDEIIDKAEVYVKSEPVDNGAEKNKRNHQKETGQAKPSNKDDGNGQVEEKSTRKKRNQNSGGKDKPRKVSNKAVKKEKSTNNDV